MYAEGINDLKSELGKRLNANLFGKLWGSTDFSSQVLWPGCLVGESLYQYFEVKPRNLLQKLKLAILPEIKSELSEPVRNYLVRGVRAT